MATATLTPFPEPPPSPETTPIPPIDTGETHLAFDPQFRKGKELPGPLAPGDAFGPRYRILRVLGAGGMGIVYHAWDEELGVAVALKVIRPEVSADAGAAKELEKRFKRELLLARQVTHRNVVRIHDIGEVEGTKYITMSFIDGRDLATALKESGHLPVSQVLPLIRQLVGGLQAAHDAGVIHRDLKPANIMVEGDAPVIMDFGIARSAVRPIEGNMMAGTMPLSRSALVTGATMQGAVVGTVAYMSPEQAKGQPADQRSDIYAVGMIMRDMLVGIRAVENPTDALNELMARVEQAPKPVREIDPTLPDAVDQIVTRCLQPDPARRYQSVQELLADLNSLDDEGKPLPKVRRLTKRLMTAIATVMLTLLVGTWWLSRTPPPKAEPAPVTVLIADFENRTDDPAFQGSIEQALATGIERASYIRLFSRSNARVLAAGFPGGSGRLDATTGLLISRREGITALLTGVIERQGSGFRLTVEAINPADGKPLASETDRVSDKSQVLPAISRMATRVRVAFGEPASDMAQLNETFTAGSLEALRAHARGLELLEAGKYDDALKGFQEAVSLDPEFGRAHALMGVVYSNLKQPDKAEAAYQQALKRLDRMTERERHRTLANYNMSVSRNYLRAIESYETLLRLYPADAAPYGNLALAYVHVRNMPKALETARKGLEANPNNLLQRSNYAYYAMYASDFETAIAEAKKVLERNPNYTFAYLPLALSSLAAGKPQEAAQTYAKLGAIDDTGASLARMGEADLEMYLGRYAPAQRILRAGIAADEKTDSRGFAAAKYVALAEAALASGQRAQAVAAARRAMKVKDDESILFPAAYVLIEAGDARAARALAQELDSRLQTQTAAYARLIEARLAFEARRWREAIEAAREAQKQVDSWFVHYLLGRVYWEAGHAPEALEELEQALKRRGETTDVFVDDRATLRYLPPLYYWAARAQEAVGATAAARANYEQFVRIRGEAVPADPLAADARRRIGPR